MDAEHENNFINDNCYDYNEISSVSPESLGEPVYTLNEESLNRSSNFESFMTDNEFNSINNMH